MTKKPSPSPEPRGAKTAGGSRRAEMKYYGYHACMAVWRARPDDVIRAYVTKERMPDCRDLLKWCAETKRAYHIVTADDLTKITGAAHHEGLALLGYERRVLTDAELVREVATSRDRQCLVYLDGVENPHNVGSLMRTAAHFGIRYLLTPKASFARVSAASYRVAEGGGEAVEFAALADPTKTLDELARAGFELLATSSHQGVSVFDYRFSRRTVLLIGAEGPGLTAAWLAKAQETLQIPGSQAVESLNVAVASAIFLAEFARQASTRA